MRSKTVKRPHAARPAADRAPAAAELLEYFYPVHYQIGSAVEDVVRAGVLSRQQAAILWLIRSEGGRKFQMRRKEIETYTRRWFEVTSAAVSKSLRAMSHAPLELVEISEDPDSGRERLVALTVKGRKFLDETSARITIFLTQLVGRIPVEVLDNAIEFFHFLTEAFQHASARDQIRLIKSEPKRMKRRVTVEKEPKRAVRGYASSKIHQPSG